MSKPLVTVITPTTHDRLQFNLQIRDIVANQDYPYIEHLFDYSGATIGAKLNNLCKRAKGDIIVRCDSDDLYSSEYVTHAVKTLLSNNYDMVGLGKSYFHEPTTGKTWLYDYNGTQKYISGAVSCFKRSFWERNPYHDMNEGEDNRFSASCLNMTYGDYSNHFLAIRHGNNTTRTPLKPPTYKECELPIGHFYRPN